MSSRLFTHGVSFLRFVFIVRESNLSWWRKMAWLFAVRLVLPMHFPCLPNCDKNSPMRPIPQQVISNSVFVNWPHNPTHTYAPSLLITFLPYTCACVCVCVCAHMHARVHTHTHTHTQTCVHAHTHNDCRTHTHKHTHTHTNTHTHTQTHTNTHTHTHTHTPVSYTHLTLPTRRWV